MSDLEAFTQQAEVEIESLPLEWLEPKGTHPVVYFQSMCDDQSPLASFVMEVVPCCNLDAGTARLHPLLLQFFDCLHEGIPKTEHRKETNLVRLESLPTFSAAFSEYDYTDVQKVQWKLTVLDNVISVPEQSTVIARLLFADEAVPSADSVRIALTGCIVYNKSSTMLLNTIDGYVIVSCRVVMNSDAQSAVHVPVAYRIDADIELKWQTGTFQESQQNIGTGAGEKIEEVPCPGNEGFLESLIELLSLRPPLPPSGILITGGAGVGKSRLAKALKHRLMVQNPASSEWFVHIMSCRDLILEASHASDEQLLLLVIPRTAIGGTKLVVVIDDLDVICNDEDELDSERRSVLSCVIQSVDLLVERNNVVIGIGRRRDSFPSELTKGTRLEKEKNLPSPTQLERQDMLMFLLEEIVKDSDKRFEWAKSLAAYTAGCVASDLRHFCATICTRVWARNETQASWEDVSHAVQRLVPSQLALLDVVRKTPSGNLSQTIEDRDWKLVFRKSWSSFAGYESTKRRLLRSVVLPWHRSLDIEGTSKSPLAIAPVSGVIFHGPTGVGKSLAASCLGDSLGLPMIKVRAADVLDKYVGGSEAIIRSVFARARMAAPCIVWLDEIDAIATNRGDSEDGGSGLMPRLLSTLLNEIDGVSTTTQTEGSVHVSNVLVVACTNRLESLDSALLRPRRLEEHIFLDLPDESDLFAILELAISSVPIAGTDKNVLLKEWSRLFVSKKASGADVVGVVQEAVLLALRRNDGEVQLTYEDIVAAMNSILRRN